MTDVAWFVIGFCSGGVFVALALLRPAWNGAPELRNSCDLNRTLNSLPIVPGYPNPFVERNAGERPIIATTFKPVKPANLVRPTGIKPGPRTTRGER